MFSSGTCLFRSRSAAIQQQENAGVASSAAGAGGGGGASGSGASGGGVNASVNNVADINAYFVRRKGQKPKREQLFRFDYSHTALSMNDYLREQNSDVSTADDKFENTGQTESSKDGIFFRAPRKSLWCVSPTLTTSLQSTRH